jgi:glycosyltransferase involved in cell wall biosynthesis
MMVVQGTRAMRGLVDREIYATDAAQPAASKPFRRLAATQLPDGAEDVPVRIFPTRRPYRLCFSPGLWRGLAEAVPQSDVVTIHSTNLFPQYAAYRLAHKHGVPYVVTPHGSLDPWLARNSPTVKAATDFLWQSHMFANAAAIHFTTEEEAELAQRLVGTAPKFIIPNGLELARFSASRSGATFRAKHLGGHRGSVVLFLGRIAKKKGIDLLIRGFARAAKDRQALLAIAGPDDEALTERLTAVALAESIADRVRFIGPVYGEAQLDALAAADIWALTSHTENFGNAVVEAMAAGCAVLVSTHVNLARQIASAEAGLVTDLSIAAIGSALSELIDDSGRRKALGSRAQEFAARFDWSRVAPQLVEMYETVAWARRGPQQATGLL